MVLDFRLNPPRKSWRDCFNNASGGWWSGYPFPTWPESLKPSSLRETKSSTESTALSSVFSPENFKESHHPTHFTTPGKPMVSNAVNSLVLHLLPYSSIVWAASRFDLNIYLPFNSRRCFWGYITYGNKRVWNCDDR